MIVVWRNATYLICVKSAVETQPTSLEMLARLHVMTSYQLAMWDSRTALR